ncbi:MAG TPA: CHAD domain-containing protein [Thermoleophilaceae bacterium]
MAKNGVFKRSRAEAAAAAAVAGVAAAGGKLALDRRSKRIDEERCFRLRVDEAVPDGIRRIARGQIERAHDELESASGRKIGPAVHEARKSLKRLRAAVRLSRDAIGDERYRQENTAFRDAGRRLSGARDAKVLIETLDSVEGAAGDELTAGMSAGLRAQLETEHEAALESLRERGATAAVLGDLEKARALVATWTLATDGFDSIEPGLRRIYRRGRNAMQAVAEEQSTENLHEWRKRVKDLWHATQIVRPASPGRMKKMSRRLHDLSDLLGDDHDLAVLRAYVNRHPQCLEDRDQQAALVAVIERRRGLLQGKALSLGSTLYEQSPKEFTRSLSRRWRKRVGKPRRLAAAV